MKPAKRWAAILLVAVTALAGGKVVAQNHASPNNGPFRTIAVAEEPLLMLEGHDAVAYFTQNEAVRGDPAIKVVHLGVTYRFASEANKEAFLKSPEAYMPQFGGFCANGINYAVPWGGGGGPDSWRIYRGKLYVFGGKKARDHFEMDTERNLDLAHRYWNEEVAGSTAIVTRLKRLVFRVPHYKSDRELQDEYEARLSARTLPVMPGATQTVPTR